MRDAHIFKTLGVEFVYENVMKCEVKLAEQQWYNLENVENKCGKEE